MIVGISQSVIAVTLLLRLLSVTISTEAFVAAPFSPATRLKYQRKGSLPLLGHERFHQNRRDVLQILLLVTTVVVPIPPSPVFASDIQRTKPYAELSALLPAVRVKVLIDRAVLAASALAKHNNNIINNNDNSTSDIDESTSILLSELKECILMKHNFTRSSFLPAIPPKPAQQYLDSYKRNVEQASWLQKPAAMLVQNGEMDTWKRLKRQERQQESQDEIRAALNGYTNSISFDGTSYVLHAPKAERSTLIREDRLPDIKTVITADMGMRYLYRNDVLNAMEEARFELLYQLDQPNIQVMDLLQLLRDAQTALALWFSLIDENDIRLALDVVGHESS